MKSDNYVVIFGWMCNELNLKGTDLLVYALIYGVSQDGKSKFSAGRNYIAETFNVSLPTVDKALQNLIDQNLIIKEPCKNQSETDKYFANISSKKTLLPQNISSKETLPDNKYISIKTENNTNNQQILFTDINNKEVLEVRKSVGQKFVEDYNSICKSLPKCTRVTTKRSKGISNLLKKYSYDDILTVFNKLEASDFCTGKVNGWRADIDFILREDKFVSVLEGKYDNKKKRTVEAISNNGPKYRVSAEEKEEMRRAVERGELKEY